MNWDKILPHSICYQGNNQPFLTQTKYKKDDLSSRFLKNNWRKLCEASMNVDTEKHILVLEYWKQRQLVQKYCWKKFKVLSKWANEI